ncbi:uncharacterized protein LOC110603031 isoform X2 [Manihot esculenta]|uniref:uncharacterized protein LOC110603031 isoform X2 n=1 Tax=Manihot esculenta TaxID=3983 RepID=UPI001CC7F1BD|nr:uncharacterized protein LOC110603031 isoform X2 [Manihot esculenta]
MLGSPSHARVYHLKTNDISFLGRRIPFLLLKAGFFVCIPHPHRLSETKINTRRASARVYRGLGEIEPMGHHGAIETAKTVIEVADVAWKAMEFTQHHQLHSQNHENHEKDAKNPTIDDELESLRSENQRLRNQLEKNLQLLRNLSESPCLLNDCPPDLYTRLVATVDSENFLARLKSLQQASANKTMIEFPFKEATGDDIHSAEILINVSHEEPSWWVWVTEEMVPNHVEEPSGIDDENYVVVTEEHVVDGVANFMVKCILSNPKALNMTPEELQKSCIGVELY